MEVKPGYKQTEVGPIPIDWKVMSLGSLAPIETGSTPPTQNAENYGKEFMFVSPLDLGSTKHVNRTEKMLSSKGFALSRPFPKDSILFVCIGSTIGKCGIASELLTSNQQINAIFPSEKISSNYLYYAVSAVAPTIKRLAGEQAVPIVNKTQFSETLVRLPSNKAEQEAIAGALNDADALIESLEYLINKKRNIKQATMQELLSGNKRLPGCNGKWQLKFLGEIGEALIGLTYTPNDVRSDGVLVLRSSNIFEGALSFQDNVFVQMEIPQRLMVRNGDILICVRNGSRDLIGKCAKIDKRVNDMTFGAFMAVFRTTFHDFVFHQFQSEVINRQIREHLGATINQITNKSLNSFQIPFPTDQSERIAIAEILNDLDSDIAALESKVTKARQIKQGMMQELLTGRIRLV